MKNEEGGEEARNLEPDSTIRPTDRPTDWLPSFSLSFRGLSTHARGRDVGKNEYAADTKVWNLSRWDGRKADLITLDGGQLRNGEIKFPARAEKK